MKQIQTPSVKHELQGEEKDASKKILSTMNRKINKENRYSQIGCNHKHFLGSRRIFFGIKGYDVKHFLGNNEFY
jgi:hypothetical protein